MRNSIEVQWNKRRNDMNAKKERNRYEKRRWDSSKGGGAGGAGSFITDIVADASSPGSSTSLSREDHEHMGMPWISAANIAALPTASDYAPGVFAWAESEEQAFQQINDAWVRLTHFYEASTLPATNVSIGDMGIDTDTSKLSYYNGGSWVEIGLASDNVVYQAGGVVFQTSTNIPISHFS